MLAQTLKTLERDGLVRPGRPARHSAARGLQPDGPRLRTQRTAGSAGGWAFNNAEDIINGRA